MTPADDRSGSQAARYHRGPSPSVYLLAICLIAGVLISAWGAWRTNNPVVVLTWIGTAEIDTIGYNVLRSDRADGDYVRVNPSLIPVHGEAFIDQQYEYRDRPSNDHYSYYYVIERVYLDRGPTQSEAIVLQTDQWTRWVTWFGVGLVLFSAALIGKMLVTRKAI